MTSEEKKVDNRANKKGKLNSDENTGLLEGRVAQVLNERELVINLGSESGVKIRMTFAVMAEAALPIIDPDTGEELALLDREKVRVRATEIMDRISICRTYHFRTVGGGILSTSAAMQAMFNPEERIYDTFDATKDDYPAPLSPDQSYVQIGDRVKQVVEPKE